MSVRFIVCGLAALGALAGCGGSGSSPSGSVLASAINTKRVALSVSGTPATTVVAGQTYSFTPTVSGGATVTYSIQNAPAWASFNTRTGQLSGTPQAANAGTYSNIVVSASANGSSASLPPFAITVAEANSTTGTADVSWTPPTTNTDGSTLLDLAGYNIYYGTSPTALTQMVEVSNVGVTNEVISGLTSGTWYFAVTAYTSNGAESALSNVASKSIT
ncbi:MAG: fibronectin type III domain-containing protein [Pseudomonadota bacterium]|nr:fibronectin type III domain-containing protein [Pseudomonadota bacterium]